ALKKNDVIIVAGDVADSITETVKELERIAAAYKTVLYIDGNHEYSEELYKKDGDITAFDDNLRVAISHLPNVHFLKDGPVTIDGTAIIGRNGHWDYKALEGASVEDAQAAIMDKIRLPLSDATIFSDQAKKDVADLKQLVKDLNADPDIHSIFVVTHTLPGKDLMPARVKGAPPVFSNLGNSEMADVLTEDTGAKIKNWVFGHWHGYHSASLNGVEYNCHPRGTPRPGKPEYTVLEVEVKTAAKTAAPKPQAPKPPAP
ncbi:MAG: metallophosphoesterase, partial [Alphaproteobacteria bacterium]